MATRKKTKKSRLEAAVIETEQGDFKRLLQHAEENTMLYLAAFGFLGLCLIAGSLYRLNQDLVKEEKMTAYTEAMLEIVDPALQAAELERLATGTDKWSLETLYLLGETALRAREFDKAKEAFTQVVADAPQTEYAPRAADGLAFLMENSGDYEGALAGYQGVLSRWRDTLTAKREPLNIGRVFESLDRIEEAIQSYTDQGVMFPDSYAAARATQALDRLREKHPDLFPALPVTEDAALTESVEAIEATTEGAEESSL